MTTHMIRWLFVTVLVALAFIGAWTVGVWLAGGQI